jgi:hypothetical protein
VKERVYCGGIVGGFHGVRTGIENDRVGRRPAVSEVSRGYVAGVNDDSEMRCNVVQDKRRLQKLPSTNTQTWIEPGT